MKLYVFHELYAHHSFLNVAVVASSVVEARRKAAEGLIAEAGKVAGELLPEDLRYALQSLARDVPFEAPITEALVTRVTTD
jgi:hypothetical protein